MKKINSDEDAMSRRVIDEITFQASILALHTAIESAGRGAEAVLDNEPLRILVERARRPAGNAECWKRPDSRGF